MHIRMLLVVGLGGMSSVGCGVSFQFGGAPVYAPNTDQVQQCIDENRLVTRSAYSSFTDRQNIGGNVVLITNYRGRGVTFYRGRQRLTAEQALALLKDPQLQSAYLGLYKPNERKGAIRTTTGGVLTGVGLAATVVGMGVMLAPLLDSDRSASSAIGPMFYAGLSLMIVGSLATVIGGLVLRNGIKHRNIATAYRTIFITGDLKPALQRAIHRYNQAVARRCGRTTPVSPPAPPAP